MKTLLTILFIFFTAPIIFLTAQTISTVAGNFSFGPGYSGDGGPATGAELNAPANLSIDRAGNMFIADFSNQVIREVNTSGTISTVAGNNMLGYSGNGGPATAAELHNPTGVITDDTGNMYIADNLNYVIRKVNTSGIITLFAGDHTSGYSGDGGPATSAKIKGAFDITIFNGSIYFTDNGNNVVRQINTSGIINTIAGNGVVGYSGDGGPATSAEMHFPNGLGFDHSGNLYISDETNLVIREVNTSGIITSIVGNGIRGYSGDGGPATAAELNKTVGLTADSAGNIYIADWGNNVIRMVNTSGIITTIAGNNAYGSGYSGDGGPATSAEIHNPNGVAVDYSGNFYIADQANNVIREVTRVTTVIGTSKTDEEKLSVYPNPNGGKFFFQFPKINEHELVEIYNVLGEKVYARLFSKASVCAINLASQLNGIYFYKIYDGLGDIIGEGKIALEK